MENSKIENLITAMLTENTGIHMMDSGGASGRAWQRNQGKTVADFKKSPEATYDGDSVSVSTFHYLTRTAGLSLDDNCDAFNGKFANMEDWESGIYGVSKAAEDWLTENLFTVGDSFNTYNGDWLGDQTLQGTNIERGNVSYVLLQIHGGADVRGGYTDAKLFKLDEGFLYPPEVWATTEDGKDWDTCYDGSNLVNAEDQTTEIPEDAKIKAIGLMER